MLQIISGRFFGDGKIEESQTEAVLYSNFSFNAPIKTSVFELRPVESNAGKIASYVLRFNNRYEQASSRDPLILPPGDEVIEQFRLLASFYFQSYFHVERAYVDRLCRADANSGSEKIVPKTLIPRFFDLAKQGTPEEVAGFVSFIEKAISLPRASYRLLISCLTGFFSAFEAVEVNFDLAYSTLVYMLEGLRRSADLPNPSWEDYDPYLRNKLDEQLTSVDPNTAEKIRQALLSNPHLRLKKRFVNFVSAHISDAFFTTEAESLNVALAKSELRRALENLYDARSGYVQELKQARQQLTLPSVGTNNDLFRWKNEPHFTFPGLVRLACHVLTAYIARQPALERESCDWRRQLPDRLEIALAPEHWAWRPEGFQPSQARQRFNAFLQQLTASFYSTGQFRPLDIRPLMEPIETLIPSAEENRLPLLVLYWMFNGMIAEEHRRSGWEAFIGQWESEFANCSIEFLTMLVLWNRPVPWPAPECAETFEQYQASRHKETATRLPRLAEIAIMGEIAGRFLVIGQLEQFDQWLDHAVLDASGHKKVQEYLRHQQKRRRLADVAHILSGATAEIPADETDSSPIPEAAIRLRAYVKWEAAGKPENTGDRFWVEAQKEFNIAA